MKYNKTAYEKAERELSNRKQKSEADAKKRFNDVAAAAPELLQIENMMKSNIIKLTKLMLTKKDNAAQKPDQIKAEMNRVLAVKQQILETNGFSPDYLDVRYSCPLCGDTGFIDGTRCNCFLKLINKYAVEELNRFANLPDCDFEHFDLSFYRGQREGSYDIHNVMENVYRTTVRYAEEFNHSADSLLLYGKTGLGKTHLSLSIAKRVIEKGYTVAYNSIINFLDEISKEKYGRSDDNTKDTEREIIDVDLLVIDDLGSEHSTPYLESIIYNIINTRMNLQKPTIINCNLDKLENLRERYNDRIVSRIVNFYKRIHFGGSDIRQLNRKNYN
jgi:DNA replication protein DnaC